MQGPSGPRRGILTAAIPRAQHFAPSCPPFNPRGLLRDADCFAFGLSRPLRRPRPRFLQRCPASTTGPGANLSEPFPCLTCGACCATYRASFYWTEAEGPLEAWTERLTPHLACMVGTNRPEPRCAALQGVVGESAFCTVYPDRPSPCRELEPGDERCMRARTRHGMGPLPPLLPVDLPGLAALATLDLFAVEAALLPEPPVPAVAPILKADARGTSVSAAAEAV